MGLVGMVKDAMEEAGKINLMDASRFESLRNPVSADDHASVSKLLTMAENSTEEEFEKTPHRVRSVKGPEECPVLGVTEQEEQGSRA